MSLHSTISIRQTFLVPKSDPTMALSCGSSLTTPKPSLRPAHRRVFAIHAADPSKTPSKVSLNPGRWSIDTWQSKPVIQLPEYPNKDELAAVLKTIESFPPIVFAGEARHLEEKLADAAVGRAFLLQGGDCAESFKEFNANNIRDTFRVLLQMGVVLMFGGQVPIIKVCWVTNKRFAFET